jgi:hypothetical protein
MRSEGDGGLRGIPTRVSFAPSPGQESLIARSASPLTPEEQMERGWKWAGMYYTEARESAELQ